MIAFFEPELVLTVTAFQGETGFAVQGVGELHEGGAGHVCHSGQVSEGGDQVGIFFFFQSWTHQKRNIIDKVDCKMTRAVEKIDWVRDESIVVERLKTGELPPADVQVDDSTGNFLPHFFPISVSRHV